MTTDGAYCVYITAERYNYCNVTWIEMQLQRCNLCIRYFISVVISWMGHECTLMRDTLQAQSVPRSKHIPCRL